MSDERRDLAEPALPPLRRLRTWFGLAPDPRLRRPEVPRLRPIRRAWAPAALEARAAVAARVPLADYLRARLARYETALPVPRVRLPLLVELAGGEIRSTLLPERPAGAVDPAAGAAALEALDGPSAVREWAQVHARIAGLAEDAAAARGRAEAIAERLSADVACGALVTAPDDGVPAEALGRPRVRNTDALYALTATALAIVVAEAWAIAIPLLFLADAYPPALSGPRALEAALLLGFALGASFGLLSLAYLAVEAAEGLARGASPRGRRRWVSFAAAFGLLAAVSVASAATHSAPRSGIPPARHALLLLALPIGAAFAVRRGQREHAARAQERAAALAWDRERAIALAERARRIEELAWAEAAAEASRRRLDRARRRSRELARRADTAARLLEDAARRERRQELRLAQSLLAALERDRYEYVRHAASRRAAEAIAARRAAAPESRGDAGGAERSAGSGRLAG